MEMTEHAKPVAGNLNKRPGRKPKVAVVAPEPPKRPVTKRDRLQARLTQADGASLPQLEKEFGWQPHTVRAAISGLRKAGLEVQREVVDTCSVYRIVTAGGA